MSATARLIIKTAALLASAATSVLIVALFAPMPGPTQWTSFLADNALLSLLFATPIAAALLVAAQDRWSRVLPLCALVPSSAAAIFALAMWMSPPLHLEVMGLAGFLLVEVALPLSAAVVVVAAFALVVKEAAVWLKAASL